MFNKRLCKNQSEINKVIIWKLLLKKDRRCNVGGAVLFGVGGEVTFGQISDIENIEMIGECFDNAKLAKVMQKAGEFIIKSSKNGKTS